MESSRKRLMHRLVELMERMSANMRISSPEEWSGLELTMPQARTLLLISQGAQRMGSIAMNLGGSLPSATGMIDRLVAKGLVERIPDPDDRRVVSCHLTSLGEQEVEHLLRIGRMEIEMVANVLTEEELEIVVKAVEILQAGAERQTEAGLRESQKASDR